MFDAGERGCPCAAIVACNHQMIGFGLGHARGDGTYADFGTQFDADPCTGIRVFQVVNQLCDILD